MNKIKIFFKKACVCWLAIALLTPIMPVSAAETISREYTKDNIVYLIEDNIATVIKYNGSEANVIIPDTVNGAMVKTISNNAFSNCDTLETITIPYTVTKITDGEYNLNGSESMGAFSDCDNLQQVIIPDNSKLSYIGEWTFCDCKALKEITLPNTIRELGLSSFEGCESLVNLTLPDGITTVAQNALSETGIKSLYIPASIESFDTNNSLPQLEKVEVSEDNLQYLSKDGVMFYYGPWNEVEIDSNGGMYVIEHDNGLCLQLYPTQKKDEKYELPDECEVIFSSYDLKENKYLKNIDLKYVSELDVSCILCDFEVADDNPKFKVQDRCLYSKDGKILYRISPKIQGRVIINEGTQVIGGDAGRDGAFEFVFIPDSVTVIDNGAFFENSNLLKVEGGNNVIEIGSQCFQSCTNLNSIDLSENLKTIRWNAFINCDSLTEIEIPDSVTDIEYQAFCSSGLKKVKLPSNLKSLPSSVFMYCFYLKDINIPIGMEEIGNCAFYYCVSLTEMVIPDSVTKIGTSVFKTCNNLTLSCYSNSLAEQYAKDNDINSKILTCNNHTFTPWEIVNDATCTTTGEKKRICTYCGKVEIDTIEKKAHNYSNEWTTDELPTCTKAGSKSHHCTNCSAKTDVTEISATGHSYKTTIQPATTSKDGKITRLCSSCKQSTSTKIYKISTIKIAKSDYSYNGKVISPAVSIKDSRGIALKQGRDYSCTYQSGRKNVGKYYIKINFKGNFSGTKYLYFNIKPTANKISKLSKSKNTITVSMSKQSTQTTGYQIQYSTSASFASKYTKLYTTSNNKTTKVTLKNLKKGTKYYIRVRTYKTAKVGKNYVKFYSGWSSKKSIYTGR